MALFDFLKRKKEAQRAKDRQQPASETHAKRETLPGASEKKPEGPGRGVFSYTILKEPHISEKATNLATDHTYVFKISDRATKSEVKNAVEGTYGVKVNAVRIIHIPKKKRRLGKVQGFKKGYAKAMVTVPKGQKIEIV